MTSGTVTSFFKRSVIDSGFDMTGLRKKQDGCLPRVELLGQEVSTNVPRISILIGIAYILFFVTKLD
jgi:hypothetical protein